MYWGMARLTPAVMRALDILELFAQGKGGWNTNAVADATSLPRTSTHEILTTLAHRGYLVRDDAGFYSLGVATVKLANAYSSSFDLLAASTVAAREVATATGATSSVAIREGKEIFYLARVDGTEVLHLISAVGRRAPANCTGLGKTLLAELDDVQIRQLYADGDLPALTQSSITTTEALVEAMAEIRLKGYGTEYEESGPGVACAAAPIRNGGGKAVAAISITVPLARWAQFPEQHWADIVLEAAQGLSHQLGGAA